MRRLPLVLAVAGALIASANLEASDAFVKSAYVTTETGEVMVHREHQSVVRPATARTSFGSRCKRVWAARVYRNIFGTVLWKYFQQQGFCYNGARVTSLFDWRRWPELYAPGWTFKGHIGRAVTGRAGTWHYGTWTQGKFGLCFAWCIETRTPWVDLDVYGNGAWTHRTGGT